MQYLGIWASNIESGILSADLKQRPLPVGMLYDNTTVQGSWISLNDMRAVSEKYGRVVNNVTMAMPHSGLFAAASDPINGIMQPQDINASTILVFVTKTEADAMIGSRTVPHRRKCTISRRQCLVCGGRESGNCAIGLYRMAESGNQAVQYVSLAQRVRLT